MDEKPDQIIGHIEAKRDELGRNLSELEDKVRRTADWRTHFDRNPMLILGAALGGGLLLGSMVGARRSSSRTSHTKGIRPWKPDSSSSKSTASSYYTPASSSESASADVGGFSGTSASHFSKAAGSGQMKQLGEALDNIKGALIAFGIAKSKEFLAQAVPGLENHLGDLGGNSSSSSSSTSQNTRKSEDGQQQEAKPYTTGSSADYRGGTQSYTGGSTSYGTGSPATPNPASMSNTGRASEADEYAGAKP